MIYHCRQHFWKLLRAKISINVQSIKRLWIKFLSCARYISALRYRARRNVDGESENIRFLLGTAVSDCWKEIFRSYFMVDAKKSMKTLAKSIRAKQPSFRTICWALFTLFQIFPVRSHPIDLEVFGSCLKPDLLNWRSPIHPIRWNALERAWIVLLIEWLMMSVSHHSKRPEKFQFSFEIFERQQIKNIRYFRLSGTLVKRYSWLKWCQSLDCIQVSIWKSATHPSKHRRQGCDGLVCTEWPYRQKNL